MKRFVDKILRQLLHSPVHDTKITPLVHGADCPLPIAIAVYVGLIVNERLANAFKHAFVNRKEGRIEICLGASEEGRIDLTVSDDGVGLPLINRFKPFFNFSPRTLYQRDIILQYNKITDIMVKKARVLIVEDEALVAEDLEMAVTGLGYEVVGHADSADDAVKKAVKLKPDVILMDIVLKGQKTGIDASHEIKAKMDIPIIFLTAYTDIGLMDKAKSTEPYAYLVKPFQERQLLASIEMGMHKCQMETRLKESEEFSFSLQNNSPNPIIVINPDTTLRYVNPALEKLTGFSSKDLIGKKAPYPWWTAEGRNKSGNFEGTMRKEATKREAVYQKKTGERFWVEITTTPVKSNGEFKYYLANWVDVTERKQAEEALQKAHDELELRVKERTAELERSNEELKNEIREREQAEQKVKNLELSVLHRLFKRGKGYLLVEEKPDICFKLFNKLIEYGFKGMLISRIHPSQIQEEYNITDIPLIWLTQVREENCIEPTNITQLSIAVKGFAERSVEGVILLEGLEYLIVQNGFEVVLRFVQTMADIVMISKCRLIISFDAQTLGEVELHRLERELNVMNANEVKVLILD